MVIAGIYVLLASAIALASIGFWKEDYWLIILSSFIFVMIGFSTIINGFEDITTQAYKWAFGIVILFIGVYLGSRAGFEALKQGI